MSGLYRKYDVYQNLDCDHYYAGDEVSADTLTFTLVPEFDIHARVALHAYAESIFNDNSELALAIFERIANDDYSPTSRQEERYSFSREWTVEEAIQDYLEWEANGFED